MRPGESGKRAIVFSPSAGFRDRPVVLPCGQCVGCRLEKSRQWAVRCMHEASLHDRNCFLTLTFNGGALPVDMSLSKRHWQLFAKRMRRAMGPFRFYMAGEYGELNARPHYHALCFGVDFPDRKFHKRSASGADLFVSAQLAELWPYGFSYIGAVSFESAAYVARYVMKKVSGDRAVEHYAGREPEFSLMSRRPGIGRGWIERFKDDVYPSDEVIVRGRRCRPPRYYDDVIGSGVSRSVVEDVRFARERDAKRFAFTGECSGDRLVVRETVAEARVALKRRSHE